jgi:hypothetical protein
MDGDDVPVARIMQVTGCDDQQARFFLEATNGDMDRAVQMFLGESMR